MSYGIIFFFFFSSRRRHTRLQGDWSSDVCSSDLWVDQADRDQVASTPFAPPSSSSGDQIRPPDLRQPPRQARHKRGARTRRGRPVTDTPGPQRVFSLVRCCAPEARYGHGPPGTEEIMGVAGLVGWTFSAPAPPAYQVYDAMCRNTTMLSRYEPATRSNGPPQVISRSAGYPVGLNTNFLGNAVFG